MSAYQIWTDSVCRMNSSESSLCYRREVTGLLTPTRKILFLIPFCVSWMDKLPLTIDYSFLSNHAQLIVWFTYRRCEISVERSNVILWVCERASDTLRLFASSSSFEERVVVTDFGLVSVNATMGIYLATKTSVPIHSISYCIAAEMHRIWRDFQSNE